jgi:hypothetical protein
MTMMTKQMTAEQMTAQQVGDKYLIRVRKQYGHTRFSRDFYLRHIYRLLRHTPMEGVSIVLIEAPRHLLLITSEIHPEDADAIRNTLSLFEAEMYPIIRDVERGCAYRQVLCVHMYPPRKTAHLPKVAKTVKHYRWVVYGVGNEKQGLLIFEEPPAVLYPREYCGDAYLITASKEQDCLRYTDLTGRFANYTVPLTATL